MKSNLAIGILNAATLLAMAEASGNESGGSDKAPRFCTREYDFDSGIVSFIFGNGTTVELDTNRLSPEMQKQLMLHGCSQKVGDSFAGVKGNFAEGIANAKGVIEQLEQGVWKAARGEGEARPRLAELAEAIARIKGVDLERATKAVEAATDDQRKTWRGNAKVKAVIAQIRAERAAKALEEAAEKDLEIAV